MSKKLLIALMILLVSAAILAQGQIAVPYMLKAETPVTLDGDLTEWAFTFPADMNLFTEPDGGRSDTNFPRDPLDPDGDLSGTVAMMWDEDNLYFAAEITDDVPGATPAASWAADGFEIYLSNVDVGDVLHGEDHGAVFYDEADGRMEVQLFVFYDSEADTSGIFQFFPESNQGLLTDPNIEIFASLNDNEDGFVIEGKLPWDALTSIATGNTFNFTGGERVPATWSLIDIDVPGATDQFSAIQFPVSPDLSPTGNPGGPVWEVIDVRDAAPTIAQEDTAFTYVHLPYAKRPDGAVTIDADLTEWAFAFPIDMNLFTEPDGGRSDATFPRDPIDPDGDLSGTVAMMWDEDNLYFAANVLDDVPGATPAASWAADGFEIYLSNVDIGTALHGADHGATFYDEADGRMEVQLFVFYDSEADTSGIFQFFPESNQGLLTDAGIEMAATLNDNEDGYVIEGKLPWDALTSNATGNTISFNGGERVPTTWSLIDIDVPGATDQFSAIQFPRHPALSPTGNPGGQVWQSLDIKGISFDQYNINNPVGIELIDDQVARDFSLEQNYPNPFNPTTSIKFEVAKAAFVDLSIYNTLGQKVRSLVNEKLASGVYSVTWDGISDFGQQVASGVYLYKMTAGGFTKTQKMVFLK